MTFKLALYLAQLKRSQAPAELGQLHRGQNNVRSSNTPV